MVLKTNPPPFDWLWNADIFNVEFKRFGENELNWVNISINETLFNIIFTSFKCSDSEDAKDAKFTNEYLIISNLANYTQFLY